MTLFYSTIFFVFSIFTQPDSIEGIWVSQDDETGREKSEVLIYKEEGKLYGKIINLLLPEDEGKKCLNCKGSNKGKPIVGMVIINDLQLEDDTWEEGTILDPKSGKVYDCTISFEDPNTLNVRGYLGFSLFGRTQTWRRKQ